MGGYFYFYFYTGDVVVMIEKTLTTSFMQVESLLDSKVEETITFDVGKLIYLLNLFECSSTRYLFFSQ